ncbi:MAG TPA: hypothetical protein ENI51_07955 [Candidatus Atribacteria bacterium]|nr:hypothetical protein [Candidatus Atribacteria bacterium]
MNYKINELDVWVEKNKLSLFLDTFEKIYTYEIIDNKSEMVRISVIYYDFGKKLSIPSEIDFQINNHFLEVA